MVNFSTFARSGAIWVWGAKSKLLSLLPTNATTAGAWWSKFGIPQMALYPGNLRAVHIIMSANCGGFSDHRPPTPVNNRLCLTDPPSLVIVSICLTPLFYHNLDDNFYSTDPPSSAIVKICERPVRGFLHITSAAGGGGRGSCKF